jgi:hypothetical protein
MLKHSKFFCSQLDNRVEESASQKSDRPLLIKID